MPRVLGFMTGTSLDGVDLAVLETDGRSRIAFGPWDEQPMPPDTRSLLEETIRAALAWRRGDAEPAIFADARAQTDRSQRRAQAVASGLDLAAAAIAAPTLVIAGELDRVVPARLTLELAASIAGAKALLLEGVGHVTVMQAPERVAGAIADFLSLQEATDASRS